MHLDTPVSEKDCGSPQSNKQKKRQRGKENRRRMQEALALANKKRLLTHSEVPTKVDLVDFEKDPIAAILLFWETNGLVQSSFYGSLNPGDYELGEEDPELKALKSKYIAYLESNTAHDDEVGNCMVEFLALMDSTQELISCASCGIRDFGDLKKATVPLREIDDKSFFKLTTLQIEDYDDYADMYKPCLAVYQHAETSSYYYMYPHLLIRDENKHLCAVLCDKCKLGVKPSKKTTGVLTRGRL
jgi:hypothetical protein